MFVSRGGETCIAIIHKAGNSSIVGAVTNSREYYFLENEEAAKYQQRVAFIRDPISRLHSAFFNARWCTGQGQSWDDIPPEYIYIKGRGRQKDYERFIDYTLKTDNIHWNTVHDILSVDGNMVPNIYHKLEDITKYWPKYFKGPLAHDNSYSHFEVEDYRLDELQEKYNRDFELWGCIDGTRYTD